MPGEDRIEVIAQQEEFYSTNPRGSSTSPVREVIGDRELPDARPNASQRQALKNLARSLRPRFSSCELAYLASAIELQANVARAAEEAGGGDG
jgi:hypothetical protein